MSRLLRLDMSLGLWPRTSEATRTQCCRSIRTAIAQVSYPIRMRTVRGLEEAWPLIHPTADTVSYRTTVADYLYLLPHALRELEQRLREEQWPGELELTGCMRGNVRQPLLFQRRDILGSPA